MQEPSLHVDFDLILGYCGKNGAELPQKKCSEYTIRPINICGRDSPRGWAPNWESPEFRNNQRSGKYVQIYLDGPSGICLVYKEQPCAIVSFFPFDMETLKIVQLQGLKPKVWNLKEQAHEPGPTKGLARLDWEKLLVEFAEAFARKQNFEYLCIQGGANNNWLTSNPKKLTLEKATIRYDNNAKRFGFKKRNDNNWYKKLDATKK